MRSKVHNPKYKHMQTQRRQLPAWNARNEILEVLNRSQVVVIVGDTGCGKTTQVSIHDYNILITVGYLRAPFS